MANEADTMLMWALYTEVTRLHGEIPGLSEEDIWSRSPKEAIRKIPLDALIDTYRAQGDYSGKTHFLSRIAQLDPDLSRRILTYHLEDEDYMEDYANIHDYDYEVEFLSFLETFDSHLFDRFVVAKLQFTEMPSLTITTIDQVIPKWNKTYILTLVKRAAELDDAESFDAIARHFSQPDLNELLIVACEELVQEVLSGRMQGVPIERIVTLVGTIDENRAKELGRKIAQMDQDL